MRQRGKLGQKRATPRYDRIANLPRYETYESPRYRHNLELRSGRRLTKLRNFAIFLLVIFAIVMVLLTLANFAKSDKDTDNSQAQASQAKQKEVAVSATTNIAKNLPSEISVLSGQLNLPSSDLDSSLEPSGAKVAVTLLDLSSKNRGSVHYNDTIQWTSASTYKLFVAVEENREVENGALTWNSPLNNDTLSDCLYQMIHVSDNNCPQAWLQTYSSFSQLTATANSIGSKQTDFTEDDMRTSANDLANLLSQLYNGKLMNQSDTKNLLSLMENQEYRDGIPSGIAANISSGKAPSTTVVADKVGFVDDYTGPVLNDAGIVISPKGTYVLVITTNGYSWQFIANLTSWIDAQME